MKQSVRHRGSVQSIEQQEAGKILIKVRVEKASACAACHAKGICSEQGSERIIEVVTSSDEGYNLGDDIVVALEHNSMGLTSVVWAYMLPLVVLLATLFGTHALGVEEGLSALASVAMVGLYYLVLYILRGYFDKKIKFTIIKE